MGMAKDLDEPLLSVTLGISDKCNPHNRRNPLKIIEASIQWYFSRRIVALSVLGLNSSTTGSGTLAIRLPQTPTSVHDLWLERVRSWQTLTLDTDLGEIKWIQTFGKSFVWFSEDFSNLNIIFLCKNIAISWLQKLVLIC